jgi:hypothetical protein
MLHTVPSTHMNCQSFLLSLLYQESLVVQNTCDSIFLPFGPLVWVVMPTFRLHECQLLWESEIWYLSRDF